VQYHESVERLLLIAFGPLVIAAVLLVIITGMRNLIATLKSRPAAENFEAARKAHLDRLLNPQAAAVEGQLGKLLPERLLELYEDKSAIQSGGFKLEKPGKMHWRRERWPVYCFEPLDTEGLNGWQYEHEFGPGFCFATTGRGCWYWIAASNQRAKDSPVIFLDYDGSGSHGVRIADSLDEFLSWRRLPM
jgi:SMI1 / KNR4 family (SUKH-1)